MRHAMTYRNSEIPADSTKGLFFDDECNRTACNNLPARWFNVSTKAYYCNACADLIDWRKDRGTPRICIEVDHDLSAEEMDALDKSQMQARIDADAKLDAFAERRTKSREDTLREVFGDTGDSLNPRVYTDNHMPHLPVVTINIRPEPGSRKGVERKQPNLSKRTQELLAESKRMEEQRRQLAAERYAEELRLQALADKPIVDAAAEKRARKNAKRLANLKG